MYTQFCIALLASFTFSDIVLAQLPMIPCPQFFRYVGDTFNNIEGHITVPYDHSGSLNLKVNASMRGFYGKLRSNMKLDLLTAPVDVLRERAPFVNYRLSFPVQESIPQITSIVFNHQVYCSGPPMPHTSSKPTILNVSHKYPSSLLKRQKRNGYVSGVLDIPPEGNDYFYPEDYVDYDILRSFADDSDEDSDESSEEGSKEDSHEKHPTLDNA